MTEEQHIQCEIEEFKIEMQRHRDAIQNCIKLVKKNNEKLRKLKQMKEEVNKLQNNNWKIQMKNARYPMLEVIDENTMTELPIKIRDWRKIKYYPVSAEKLNKITAREVALLLMPINVGEDYEYFDEVKHLLDIPEKPKTPEEINKKFDELIEKTKRNYYASNLTAENNYNRQFDRIFDNFENLKRYGSTPKYGIDCSGVFDLSSQHDFQFIPSGNPSKNWKCYLFGSKPGGYNMVYHPQENQVPNAFVRWCSNVFLGCMWVKEK